MSRKSLVPIVLPADPTQPLEAATKQYVDASGGGGSGFTFVQDTAPTPTKEGDTWFDLSDAASGGTSWIAVSEVPGSAGPLNWVQFAPGTEVAASKEWISWSLVWSGSSGNPNLGDSAPVRARSRLDGDVVEFYIHVTFGSTVNGGLGQLSFNLPYPAHSEHPEQFTVAKLYHANGQNYVGFGFVSGGSVAPFFPQSATLTTMGGFASTNASGATGTGIPTIAGAYTVSVGGNITVMGRYRKAP